MAPPFPLHSCAGKGASFQIILDSFLFLDFPGGLDSKVSVYNAGNWGSIPGLGRSPGEGNGDPLEKEMAIHSSTIAWKIPWTEKPDRLQSMGSQRVGHD